MMKKLNTGFRALLLVSICLIISGAGLAACGTQPGSENKTQAPFRIGVILPLSGPNASVGVEARWSIELALSDHNRNPANRKLEATFEDGGATREEAIKAYSRVLGKGKPLALIAGVNSSQAGLLFSRIKGDNIPAIVNLASSPQLISPENEWLFFTRTLDDSTAQANVQFVLTRLKKQRIALLHSNDELGFGMGAIYLQEFSKQGILPVVRQVNPIDATDFSAAIDLIKKENADVVVAWQYTLPAQALVRQIRQAGLNLPIIGSVAFGLESTIQSLSPGYSKNVYAVVDSFPVVSSDPAVQSFVKRYRQDNPDSDPDGMGIVSYDSISLLGWVANQGVDDTRAVRKTLTGLQNFKGLKGLYGYFPGGNGRLAQTSVLLNLNGGQPVIIS